jgi:hypothetical protein
MFREPARMHGNERERGLSARASARLRSVPRIRFVARVKRLAAIAIRETEANLHNKISRGGSRGRFSFNVCSRWELHRCA